MAKIKGSGDNDRLFGTNKADHISGRGGNDTIFGRGGNDKISGDDGDDKIFGGAGNDWIDAGSGNDLVFGGSGNDKIFGGKGDDRIFGSSGNDKISGGKGNDSIYGGSGNDRIDAGSGNDLVFGGSGNDRIDAGSGNDLVFGGSGNDWISGGKGNDSLDGGAGSDRLFAGKGNDFASYNMAENLGPGFVDVGTHDAYDGGRGYDTLQLTFTHGEFQLASVQQDIVAYEAFLSAHANPWNDCGPMFHFASFDLDARGFEALEIQLVNAGPTANDDAGATDEDTVLTVLPTGVLANDTDPDHLDQLTVVGADAVSAIGALVVVSADGSYSYDPNGQFEYLAVGESVTDSFDYTIRDLAGATDAATVRLLVTGVNDAPVITSSAQTGDVSEGDDLPSASRSAQGQVTFTDVDLSDTHSLSASAATYGSASVDADGTWHYTVSDTGAVDALAVSEHLTDYFTVQVDDHNGGFDTQVVSIDIVGTNDAPMITSNGGGDSANVSVPENTMFVANVDADDPDTGALLTYTILNTVGTDFAAFNINSSSGVLKFNLAPDFETPTDVGGTPGDNTYVVDVQVSDGFGGTDTQSIAVTVTGSHAVIANDDIVLTNVPQGAVISIPASALLANDTDSLNHPLHIEAVANAAENDVVSLMSGGVTYTDNDPLHGSFDYTASDDGGVESAVAAHVTVETQVGVVQGAQENEILIGSDGDDMLFGGAGDDLLFGEAGNDTLVGGAGDDVLFADAGNDMFDYNALSDAGPAGDLILSFGQQGTDHLDLHELLSSIGAPHDSTAITGGYLRVTTDSATFDTLVEVDSNGGGDMFQALATVAGVPLTLDDLIL